MRRPLFLACWLLASVAAILVSGEGGALCAVCFAAGVAGGFLAARLG